MKFWLKILLLLLFIVILDRIIGSFLKKAALDHHYDRRIERLINNELNKDIYIVGSSRAMNGFDPETINKETGKTCFNLSYSGSNVEFHKTVMDVIFHQKHKPEYVIYNLDDPGTLIDFGGMVVYKKEELYPYVYNDFINKIVCNRLDKSYYATKVSNTFLQNVNFINTLQYITKGKEKPSFQINNIDSNGSNLMDGHQEGYENMIFNKEILTYKREEEFPPYITAFNQILEIFRKNSTKLILVISPSYFSKNIGFKERVEEFVNDDFLILDYSDEFKNSELFYNYGHLNKKGAIKFSKILSNDLKNTK